MDRSGRGPATLARTLLTTTVGRRRGDDGEVLHAAHEALEPDRVGGADDDEVVGGLEGGQGRGVAAGRGGVVAELLVVLEREPDVDDDVVDDPAGQAQHVLDGARPAARATGRRSAGR